MDNKVDTQSSLIMNMEKATWRLSGTGLGGLVSTQCIRKFKGCLRGRREGVGKRIETRWWKHLLAFKDRRSCKRRFNLFFLGVMFFVVLCGIDSTALSGILFSIPCCWVCNSKERKLELFDVICITRNFVLFRIYVNLCNK